MESVAISALEAYEGQVRVFAAGVRSGEGSKAGMSAMTSSTSTKSSKAAGMRSGEGSKAHNRSRLTDFIPDLKLKKKVFCILEYTQFKKKKI